MRYSVEPRHGFLSFAKNIDKNVSNKYRQKLLDSAKKSTTGAVKSASKRAIQKTEEATGELIGNEIADKITSVSKKSTKELQNNETEVGRAVQRTYQKKDAYLQRKDHKLLMN